MIQYNVLYLFQRICRNVTVEYGSSRIDDPHIHPLLDGMIKEYRMHCFTNIIIATERERKITYSPADVCTGKIFPDPSGSFYKVYGVIVMLFDSCSHRKHIRVENNIMRIESNFINQQTICTFAHFYLAGSSIRLSFFIKSHHDSCRSILLDDPGMLQKYFLPFLQRDRVYD